jgi:hypothetical protein
MKTNDASYTREMKSTFVITKAAFNNRKTLFNSKWDLNLRKKLVKRYILSIPLFGAETWTLRTVDEKYLVSSEMWC